MALKDSIRRHPALLEIALLARNAWLHLPFATRETERIGSTHQEDTPAEAVAYISRVFDDYLRYGEVSRAELEGARVLEIGPGDNVGLALRLIGAGAERVVCVERFHVWRDQKHEARIYAALLEQAASEERLRMEDAVTISDVGIQLNGDRVQRVEGVGIENADQILDASGFDLVVSRVALEYVQGMRAALRVMDKALAPGGLAIHKIDLRDHGLYTGAGHHPLSFLRRSAIAWRTMATRSGVPNRWRESDYVGAFEVLGYETTSLITHVTGEAEELDPHAAELSDATIRRIQPNIDAYRRSLAVKFRHRSLRDLAVAGIFLRAKKAV